VPIPNFNNNDTIDESGVVRFNGRSSRQRGEVPAKHGSASAIVRFRQKHCRSLRLRVDDDYRPCLGTDANGAFAHIVAVFPRSSVRMYWNVCDMRVLNPIRAFKPHASRTKSGK